MEVREYARERRAAYRAVRIGYESQQPRTNLSAPATWRQIWSSRAVAVPDRVARGAVAPRLQRHCMARMSRHSHPSAAPARSAAWMRRACFLRTLAAAAVLAAALQRTTAPEDHRDEPRERSRTVSPPDAAALHP